MSWTNRVKARQEIADSIQSACDDSVNDKIKRKSNYHDTYLQEIIYIIVERLNKADADIHIEFEDSLKQHICGTAARKFQKMHEGFFQENHPYRCLQKNKHKFCADFKDLFYERDLCLKKAEELTKQCLKPAVEDFIDRSLGHNIINEMLTREEFSTRMSFQYSVLGNLISKNEFECCLYYICSYEEYLKSQIF